MAGTARPIATTTLLVVLALAGLTLAASPAAAAAASPSAENLMVRLINNERELRGLRPLARNLQLVRLGRDWAGAMAATGQVSHRRDLAVAIDGEFTRLGENVGYTRVSGATAATLVRRLHRSFMASSGHRYHVLGDYNLVGVGVHRSSDGAMWMAVNFIKGPRDGFPLFRDIAGSRIEPAVERLFLRGIVGGCYGHRYCPRQSTSRALMATVLDNATGSRTASSALRQTCGTSSCADSAVTRIEAARMIAAALNLDSVPGRTFTDVASSAQGEVNAVVQAGIMGGCETTRFCPSDTISRGQLAGMIDRALS